jgi:hypothetical protein
MMRALGPGSVSSLLKLVLDVISFALWAALAALIVIAFIALLLPVDLGLWRKVVADEAALGALQARGPVLAAGLLAFAVYLGVVQYIVQRLRHIFATLTAGDPFRPDNVKRLRAIGFGLAGLELINYATPMLSNWAFRSQIREAHWSVNLTAWFAVLVVFVLAEVFREGARLRSEAELTI